ncbi:hypothetical protein ACFX13_035654 [Malus domestica]
MLNNGRIGGDESVVHEAGEWPFTVEAQVVNTGGVGGVAEEELGVRGKRASTYCLSLLQILERESLV